MNVNILRSTKKHVKETDDLEVQEVKIEELLINSVEARPLLWDCRLPLIQRSQTIIDELWLEIYRQFGDQQIGIILQRDLQLAYQNFTKDIFRDCEYNEELAEIPISFKDPIYGSNQPSFTDFVAPGVILTQVFFPEIAIDPTYHVRNPNSDIDIQ
ncbi:hypothetical protein JTB14_012829 [Gonioctena quinquepunctata]|nr:hypothetical protein JTB14_012829 [Gonioctena quinquepunctata]